MEVGNVTIGFDQAQDQSIKSTHDVYMRLALELVG